MKVIHHLDQNRKKEKRAEEETGVLSMNNRGDYLWLKEIPKSRYEGWFCKLDDSLYRIIETLQLPGERGISEIESGIGYVKRRRGGLEEMFFLPGNSHAMVYELSEPREVEVFFDLRESYDPGESEEYDAYEEDGVLVASFHNGIHLAVDCDDWNEDRERVEKHYPYDEARNSPPFSKGVQKALRLQGKRFVFAVSKNKEEAIGEAKKMFVREIPEKEKRMDLCYAERSLSGLLVRDEPGLHAGIPWFFQFWPRDEAISLKSLFDINPKKAREIYFRLLDEVMEEGPGGALNADAAGWLFKRTEDILPSTSVAEKERIRRRLKKCIEESLWAFTEEGLAVNRAGETWMDSLSRDGARIELQAMRLNMYRLAGSFAKRRRERGIYKEMEQEMKKKVQKIFFDKEGVFHDGYYPRKRSFDSDIRPNIFIAAYIYPDLLKKEDWKLYFDKALEKLWLSWGGVATLDKSNDNFHKDHTGEDSSSYHQGDSWFFLNALTAIVLHRFDKKKYAPYIEKIMEAGKEELLWKGTPGAHAEISSARELRSEGCINQAWSNAMYIEAVRETGRT